MPTALLAENARRIRVGRGYEETEGASTDSQETIHRALLSWPQNALSESTGSNCLFGLSTSSASVQLHRLHLQIIEDADVGLV